MNSEVYHPTPPQAEIAISRMEQKHPETARRQKALINEINRQLFTNLTTHKTEDGTVLPYATIALTFTPDQRTSSLLGRKRKKDQTGINPQNNIIEFDMFGYSLLKNEGHPAQRPDALYDRVFFYMGEAKRLGKPIDVTIVSMGQATGLGGKYSKDFYRQSLEADFEPEAKHIVSLANTFKPKDTKKLTDTRWNFYGISMGSLKALDTTWEFKASNPTLTASTDMINPPRSPGLPEEFQPSGPQLIVGFATEGLLRRKMVDIKERAMAPTYPKELEKSFEEKGIDIHDSRKQQWLKKKAVLYLNVRSIIKNDLYKRKGDEFPFPVHVRRAVYDPINMSIAGLKKNFYGETSIVDGNVTTDFVDGTHSINYYKVDTWAKNMEGVSYNASRMKKKGTNSSFFALQPVQ